MRIPVHGNLTARALNRGTSPLNAAERQAVSANNRKGSASDAQVCEEPQSSYNTDQGAQSSQVCEEPQSSAYNANEGTQTPGSATAPSQSKVILPA